MHIRTSGAGVVVWAPAKLNLFLEILGKRPDGFHEIETLMWPVSLYDTLYFTKRPPDGGEIAQTELTSSQVLGAWRAANRGSSAQETERLPEGTDNIVVRAVELLRQAAGVEFGARVSLVKRIPLAAGLGGGSSDAAAALLAANQAWRLHYSRERLLRLAAQLGSDVPFFLAGRPAVCRGRGERVEPVEWSGPWWFVIAHPPVGLSTAKVYQICQLGDRPRNAAHLQAALCGGDRRRVAGALHNALQPAAERLSPWIQRLRDEFSRLDFVAHQMSGSGSAYFGLCRDAHQARGRAPDWPCVA